ncbi:hypothetical protein MANES_03G096216v8 [Manihot esculenta]|uniref:Uncharacterized protein n=1 Tax=Manihot esculenta TaxID=3983 RepID=A0ACB7I0E6_MANES|nr:hypothetical protein MANES_03G096216v8 [Manihot esculenta]
MNVSQDPVISKQQSSQRFWSRMTEAYEVAKNEFWEFRNPRSLQCQMQVIEKVIRKLNGCYRQLNQAKTLLIHNPNYKKGFKFDHVWSMMKDAEKFKNGSSTKKVQNQNSSYVFSESNNPTSGSPMVPSSNLSSFSIYLNEDIKGRLMRSRALDLKEFNEENKILLLDLNSISDPIAREMFR